MSVPAQTTTELGGRARIRRLPHGVAYFAVVAMFGGVYGVLVYLLSVRWGVRTVAGSVRIFAAAFLVSLAIGIPLYVRVQSVVDRWLAARRRTAGTLHALFARLTTGVPVGTLVRRALEIVRTDVGLEEATLFMLAPEREEFVPVATTDERSVERRLPADHPLVEILATLHVEISSTTIREQSRYRNVSAECLAAFEQLKADLLFPIEVEGRTAGFLALAGHHGLQRLKTTDVELLRALSAELSVCAARVQDETRIRAARLDLERFARYLPRSVAKDVLEGRLPGEQGRRRNVTVVACELSNFDRLPDAIEGGELAGALRRYHVLAATETHREGGTVAYAHGAQVVAVFGDPEPHPDHAARGLRMASRFIAEARQLWSPWRPQVPDLDVQVGVATGPALVGFIAVGAEVDYQVIGRPKHDADELAERAAGGEILLTTATLAAAGEDAIAEVAAEPVGGRGAVHRLRAIADGGTRKS